MALGQKEGWEGANVTCAEFVAALNPDIAEVCRFQPSSRRFKIWAFRSVFAGRAFLYLHL